MEKIFDRIILFDMAGYGLSDKPVEGFTYSLMEQADLALQVWQHLGVKGGHLLAHDMGDSVATELVARHVSNLLPAWFAAGFQSFTFTVLRFRFCSVSFFFFFTTTLVHIKQ